MSDKTILFVHKNFPAQFGHIARELCEKHGYRSHFVCELPPAQFGRIERVQYQVKGGATQQSHYCSRSFENATWHSHAVFETLAARPDIQPDLIVGHSGFGSTLFLRELYDCPIINYFEYFYHTRNSDMDFRPEFAGPRLSLLRARARNAMLLLDLHNCDAGYSPTQWQAGRFPPEFRARLNVLFDGIDTDVWQPVSAPVRRVAGREIPEGYKVVTYVSRGFESMRGFDIFMQAAKQISTRRDDVIFVVVGEDRVCYGGDLNFTNGQTFKDWVLSQDSYDEERFWFVGRLPPPELAELFSLSDAHIYLTVPFVLSWSLMNALACGATVIASDTEPVAEMIQDGHNGLLVDFFDVDGFAERTCDVLAHPDQFTHLSANGTALVAENYSLDVMFPRLKSFFESVMNGSGGGC